MLANFLGVLPILTPPLCGSTVILKMSNSETVGRGGFLTMHLLGHFVHSVSQECQK
jgi:hypothetical protein